MKFNKEFLEYKEILSKPEKDYLESINQQYNLKPLKANRNIEDLSIDFAYNNAYIEGCTYTYKEAETLILSGITANGKPFTDAQMLLNLKKVYTFLMSENTLEITTQNIKNLHKLAMQNILQSYELGAVRNIPVRIGGSNYLPSTDKIELEEYLNVICNNSKKYTNIFEKSIYLHNNLAYLQYFTDGNKRIARITQTTALVSNNKMPLFYLDKTIDIYKKSLISYYEQGDYKEYKNFILKNYEKGLEKIALFVKKSTEKGISR